MKELSVTHKFDLVSNMAEVKEAIAETIKKYDVVVTEDGIADAKELMAQFNKDKKEFSSTCKKFIDAISEPITEFKAQQKEIEKMYDDGRAKIADQVAKFESKKLEIIAVLVRAYRNTNCESKSISIEAVSVEDLIMLSAVSSNSKGYSLTKKTTDAIDQRIQAVENEILKARLEAEEKAKRDREIADQARAEAEDQARKREAELLARAEREKAEAVERARSEEQQKAQSAALSGQNQISQPEPIQDQVITEDGKRIFVVTATFEVKAKSDTSYEKITSKLQSMIESAGITSLKSIEVR